MKYLNTGITSPKGFETSACPAGIKYEGRDDMTLIYSKAGCKTAGTYTSNIVKAAPVIWDRTITEQNHEVHAVVANSGIANACTGEEGLSICSATAAKAAKVLGVKENEVLVASTGVIGMQIPVDKITAGVATLAAALSSSEEAAHRSARAIMTTDTVPKEVAVETEISGVPVRVAAMCKGSGMIHPNMCTMLSFVLTDANITKELLVKALRDTVKDTYNMVSVDGDTSTNDTVLVLANGGAGNDLIDKEDESYDAFREALYTVNETLAKKIAGDGEGAEALFEVVVNGAETKEKAVTVAKSVVSSNLVKTAIAGHDANWGRIICAAGYSGAEFDPGKVELVFRSAAGTISIAENGTGLDFDEETATRILSEKEVTAILDLHEGNQSATAWGCDLTHGYISINADYRS